MSIAHVQEATLRQALLEVNTPDVEALVQVGTNLSMVALADEAERWLGKPVIAINAAIWWMALRDNGIAENSTAVAASYGSFKEAAMVCLCKHVIAEARGGTSPPAQAWTRMIVSQSVECS